MKKADGLTGTLVKLAVFTVISVGCLAWLAARIGQLTGAAGTLHKSYKLTAAFTDATGLVTGDDVRLAGVRIGKVGSLKVDAGKAKAEFNLDNRYKVPKGSRFELHWKNLLGQRFVEVVPPTDATESSPTMAAGSNVGADHTQAAADLSALLNNTYPLLSRLDTDRMNNVMATFAAAMQGREQELNRAIGDSSALVSMLRSRADVMGKTIGDFATLLDGIASHDDEVRQLLDSLADTSQTLAAKSDEIGQAAGKTGQFTDALAKVVAANDKDMDTVFGQTKQLLDAIVANKDVLDKAIRTLPWTTSGMIRMTSHGDWINAYVRGAGVIDAYFSEPRIGPDYNNISPDDTKGGDPLLGKPRVPVPPAPSTDLGIIAVNPQQGSSPQGAGLSTLLQPLTAPKQSPPVAAPGAKK